RAASEHAAARGGRKVWKGDRSLPPAARRPARSAGDRRGRFLRIRRDPGAVEPRRHLLRSLAAERYRQRRGALAASHAARRARAPPRGCVRTLFHHTSGAQVALLRVFRARPRREASLHRLSDHRIHPRHIRRRLHPVFRPHPLSRWQTRGTRGIIAFRSGRHLVGNAAPNGRAVGLRTWRGKRTSGGFGAQSWWPSSTRSSASRSPRSAILPPTRRASPGGWPRGWSAPRRSRLIFGTSIRGCGAHRLEPHSTLHWRSPSVPSFSRFG